MNLTLTRDLMRADCTLGRLLDQRSFAYISGIDAVVVNSYEFCKRLKRHSLTIAGRYPDVASSIARLLRRGGPPAIARNVTTAVVYAIKGRTLWPRTKFSKKQTEVIAPRLEHEYPTATIAREVLVSRIVASGFSACPARIFRSCFPGNAFPYSMAVLKLRDSSEVYRKAPTTSGVSRSKFLRLYNGLLSAVTPAVPCAMCDLTSGNGWAYAQCNQSSESTPFKGNALHGCIVA